MKCLLTLFSDDFLPFSKCPQCRKHIDKGELGVPVLPDDMLAKCSTAYLAVTTTVDLAMNEIANSVAGEVTSTSWNAEGNPFGPVETVQTEEAITEDVEEEVEWYCVECETREEEQISRDPRYCISCCYNVFG